MSLEIKNQTDNPKLIKGNFDKSSIQAGILHIGVGNFHRSHQANIIDQFMENTGNYNWGIVGLNLLSETTDFLTNLKKRNGNYVLKTISPNGEVAFREIKSIVELLDWNSDKEKSEKILLNENIHLITITVTETGYFLTDNAELDINHEVIKNEIMGKNTNSLYSYLRIALNKRKNSINKPITILCCDNLRENGKVLKKAFLKYLKLLNEKDLLSWVEKNVSFPPCVVDRITPRSPEKLSKEIEDHFNIKEDCTVLSEDFIQWVIEKDFAAPFPDLDKIENVNFTENVFDYEETKIRILNGGHTCLTYLGALKGLKTFDECFNYEDLKSFFDNLQNKEIIPALGNIKPINLNKYLETISHRFQNSHISDALERICMDGSSKFLIFIIPTIKKCFENNIKPVNSITAIASWYIFMKKIYNKELEFNYIDPKWGWLKTLLEDDKIDEFCTNKDLWGNLPENFPSFKSILKLKIKNIAL